MIYGVRKGDYGVEKVYRHVLSCGNDVEFLSPQSDVREKGKRVEGEVVTHKRMWIQLSVFSHSSFLETITTTVNSSVCAWHQTVKLTW